tara:strand:+ start:347 stop:808 length:462 start_codon:yes stop_codon:yes gene_type:complete
MQRIDGTPDSATRHDIYRNLNKARKNPSRHVWSIRAANGPHRGKVSGHSETVIIRDPEFKIAESTRQRIISDKRRAVCAYIRGTLETPNHAPNNPLYYGATGAAIPCLAGKRVSISFNPYRCGTFYQCATGFAVTAADAVIFTVDGCFAINPR